MWLSCGCNIIYLDFQKACDKVPHKRLLMKLHDFGIENVARILGFGMPGLQSLDVAVVCTVCNVSLCLLDRTELNLR